jgi:6-phosphogluconolactonase
MNSNDRDKVVEIFDDLEALSDAAARLFTSAATHAIETNGRFTVALSGGGTPRRTYELLAEPRFRDQIQWSHVHVFWGDERCVPPDDVRSNARMARIALLDHIPVPDEQVHPALWMDDPRGSAADYEAVLRMCFEKVLPRFDLILLGMGEDGHTASLFPESPALQETQGWVAAVSSKDPPRITLTYPVLNNASTVAFLVSGSNKADALRKVIEGSAGEEPVPASRVHPTRGTLHFLVDRDAAALLSDGV